MSWFASVISARRDEGASGRRVHDDGHHLVGGLTAAAAPGEQRLVAGGVEGHGDRIRAVGVHHDDVRGGHAQQQLARPARAGAVLVVGPVDEAVLVVVDAVRAGRHLGRIGLIVVVEAGAARIRQVGGPVAVVVLPVGAGCQRRIRLVLVRGPAATGVVEVYQAVPVVVPAILTGRQDVHEPLVHHRPDRDRVLVAIIAARQPPHGQQTRHRCSQRAHSRLPLRSQVV